MTGTLRLISAAGLKKKDTFGHCDPYVAVVWNGERVGQTKVFAHDTAPTFETDFELNWYNQKDCTLRLEIWDNDLGHASHHEFLGLVKLAGRSAQALPESEVEMTLELDPERPRERQQDVGGTITFVFTPKHAMTNWDGTRREGREHEAKMQREAAAASKQDNSGGCTAARRRIMAIYDDEARRTAPG